MNPIPALMLAAVASFGGNGDESTVQDPTHAIVRAIQDADSSLQQGYCCKICRQGKACGDTCIATWKTCHVGVGCACDE